MSKLHLDNDFFLGKKGELPDPTYEELKLLKLLLDKIIVKPYKKDPDFSLIRKNSFPEEPIIKSPKCECGKEKHGFANHTTWCDIKE